MTTDNTKEIAKSILDLLPTAGEKDINIDLEDIAIIVDHKGKTVVEIGEDEGANSATMAVSNAIKEIPLHKAGGILVHFHIHPQLALAEISQAMEMIYENAHPDADIIFGTTADKTLKKEYVKVTLIVSYEV